MSRYFEKVTQFDISLRHYWVKEDFFKFFWAHIIINLIQETDGVLLCLIILLWILVGLFGIMVLVARHFWSICSRGLEKSQRTTAAARRSDGHSKTLQQDRTRFLLRNNNILLLCHQDSYVMEFQVLTRRLCLSK